MNVPGYGFCGCLSLLMLALAGCGGGHGTASVSGTVVYKDQPVAGATVNFLPRSEAPDAKGAHGVTDASGRFELTTYFGPDEQPSGALPGDYAVTITKIDEPAGVYDPFKDPPPKNHLPVKYGAPLKSPLQAQVKAGETNHFDFQLAD